MANELRANDSTDILSEDAAAMNAHIPQQTIIDSSVMNVTIFQDVIIDAIVMNALPQEIIITSSSTPNLRANDCPKHL